MNASTPARVSGNTAYSKTDNISRPPDSPFPNIIYQKDPQAAPTVTSRTHKGALATTTDSGLPGVPHPRLPSAEETLPAMLEKTPGPLKSVNACSDSEVGPAFSTVMPEKGITIRRGSDFVSVREVDLNQLAPAKAVANCTYPADGAGAILIFHTKSGNYVLGGIRNNPALEHIQTKEGTAFAPQISATIGGYLADSSRPLKDSVIEAIRSKILLRADIPTGAPGHNELALLNHLCETIEDEKGWESKVSIHTDKWADKDGTEKTMCFLNAIKHLGCDDADLRALDHALKIVMALKKATGANPGPLTDYQFVPFRPIVESALESHQKSEVGKANDAHEKFGGQIAVTFNDLAVAALASNGAFEAADVARFKAELA